MSPTARALYVGLAAVATAAVPACSSNAPSGGGTGRPRVAIVTNNTAEFWSVCEAGARKAAVDFDCDVDFRQISSQTVEKQQTTVKDLVRVGVNGVAVSVVDPVEQAQDLRLVADKIPLITFDNDSPASGRRCYIGVDNYEAGKAAGKLVKQALPNGGTVALFIGSVSSANGQARVGGVIDELAGAKDAPRARGGKLGNYTLVDVYTDDAKEDVAQNKAKEVLETLKSTPDVCLVGLYAYNPPAILAAARSKGLAGKVKIVGFDGDAATLQGIDSGDIVGTVVQDPFNYGYKSVEVLAALARGDAAKAVDFSIPHRFVTKAGGPTETIGAFQVQNLKVADYAAGLAKDLASVGAKK